MKTFLEKLKDRVQCIKIQVFLSYVLVLSLAFVLLGFSVALTARQMMTKQIGASRLDLLRQISERTNTIKTSATTLVGLYRYELTELPGFPEDVELDMDAFLTEEKYKYSSVFSPIGMDHDPLIAGARGIYSSLPPRSGRPIWNPSCGIAGSAESCWMPRKERCSSAAPSPRRTAPAISSRCVRRRDRGRRTASSWC